MATLTEKVDALIATVDGMKAEQNTQGQLMREMDICLRGSGYDKQNGGIVAEVHQNTKCVKEIKRKQNKIITWGATIVGILNLGGVLALIINLVKK